MGLNTGLSGINAANQDLKVTGNNIANASTTGFKLSRAEFGDAYTQSILGMGRTAIGSGVNVANIGQKFTQGNISQTGNSLDLAIDGTGFFITDYPGSKTTYTRNGIFGINDAGFMVNNQGARLQGFGVTDRGTADGVMGDIRIEQDAQPPKATQRVDAGVNVPAGASVLQQLGSITRTNGLAIGQVQTGAPEATASTLSTVGPPRTEGTAASLLGAVNTADRYTGTDIVPVSFVYSAGPTPNINDFQGNAPANLGAGDTTEAMELDVTLANGTSTTVTVGPLASFPADINDLAAVVQASINATSLQGNILVRSSPAVANTLEFYSTDGTVIDDFNEDGGTLVADLGMAAFTADNRLLLNDLNGGEAAEITVRDIVNDVDITVALDLDAENNFASQADLITFLQTELDAVPALNGLLNVRVDPFSNNGIEIVSVDPDNEFRVTNIADTTGSGASQLNIANGALNERIFEDIPASGDTILIQVQDSNINSGTPTQVQLEPFPSGANFSDLSSLIDAFQSSLDNNSVLAGRLTVQEDPDNAGVLQLLSTTGTRIQSVTDQSGDIADTLNLVGGTISPSIFNQLPPNSP
ncbi:MAG: flagellar hook-basal body complex protein, partial [Natronospirillum sp.]